MTCIRCGQVPATEGKELCATCRRDLEIQRANQPKNGKETFPPRYPGDTPPEDRRVRQDGSERPPLISG